MTVEVRMAAALRKYTGSVMSVLGQGETIGQLIDDLERRYPGLKNQLTTDASELRPFINIYLNDEDVRFLNELETPLANGDIITILPAMAGGKIAASQERG